MHAHHAPSTGRSDAVVHPRVAHALAHAAHVLPDQGPIGVFIHHNTLHAFQHLPFHDAVVAGSAANGAEPYPTEAFLRDALARGRIVDHDLSAALDRLPTTTNEPLPLGLTVRTLRLALLREDLDVDDDAGIAWLRAHGAAGDEVVWQAWTAHVASRPPRTTPPARPQRHRDVLLAHGGDDIDALLNWELQRVAASFLDQGQALSPLPHREEGFLMAVARLFAAGAKEPRFAPGVGAAFARIASEQTSAEDVIDAALRDLGVDDDATDDFVTATLLSLPGWSGMFSRLERHPEELLHTPVPVRLADFLAVRLVYQRAAAVKACTAAGLPVAWRALRTRELSAPRPRDPILDTHILSGLGRAAGADASAIVALTADDVDRLLGAVQEFPSLLRRRVLFEAYEGHYRTGILDAVAARRRLGGPAASSSRPTSQFVFCIDEREESIRRALEELSPGHETFGAAGFFGMAIDFKGLDDEHPAAYCPVVVTPAHEVHEAPADHERDHHEARSRRRGLWQQVQRSLAATSRSLLGGAALSILGGPIAGAAIVSRVFAPRESLATRARIGQGLLRPPATRLLSARTPVDGVEARTERGKLMGFTLAEAADRVTALLKNIGLVAHERFAPIVVVLGHGSTSLNNPHESAHDCGACGGRRGGANARLFAELANRPDVRVAVRERGVMIPDDTWFVGGLHDTANDDVLCADLDAIPAPSQAAWAAAATALEAARRESARERARRFDDAPLGISPDDALRHVQGRSSHLAQPRPEYGHCTNAIAVVGRRGLTRGLFLDRRPFLISYDPTVDDNDVLLERILAAVGPVGAGINLEYYFSSIDNERFGCGTKLPHNVTGLIGVMNGHGGDLRTGLPWQMVEIHEPMRLLLIVEATPASLLAVAGRQAEVKELVVNEWVQLVSLDPLTGDMQVFQGGAFVRFSPSMVELPRVQRSVDHFGRSRGHLPPAIVTSSLSSVSVSVSMSASMSGSEVRHG